MTESQPNPSTPPTPPEAETQPVKLAYQVIDLTPYPRPTPRRFCSIDTTFHPCDRLAVGVVGRTRQLSMVMTGAVPGAIPFDPTLELMTPCVYHSYWLATRYLQALGDIDPEVFEL